MADASRHNYYAVAEVNYGVTPGTPAFQTVRHTGLTLGLSKNTQISEELRSDRQIADFKHGAKQVGGDHNFELSYGTYDDFIEAVLGGTWLTIASNNASTFAIDDSDNSINDSAFGFLDAGHLPGDRMDITGFTTNASNNQTATIKSVTAGKIVFNTPTVAFITEPEGDSVTLTTTSGSLKVGVLRRSFSMLREFSDLGAGEKPFHLFNGVEFNTMALTVTADAKIVGTFTILGRDQVPTEDAAPAGSTFIDPTITNVMDSFTGAITEAGTLIAVVTEMVMTLENGMEPRFVVGSDKTILPTIGRSNLSGTITAYFEDSLLINKFIEEEESSMAFSLVDVDGNTYVFTMPRIKYNGGQPDVSGQGAITLSMPFQALYDSVLDTNFIITRIPL